MILLLSGSGRAESVPLALRVSPDAARLLHANASTPASPPSTPPPMTRPRNRLIIGPALPLLTVLAVTLTVIALLAVLLVLQPYNPEYHATGWSTLVFVAVAAGIIVAGSLFFRGQRRDLDKLRTVRDLLRRDRAGEAVPVLEGLLIDGRLSKLQHILHFLLGKAYDSQGETQRAIGQYRAAQGFWPAHNNLATLLLEAGDIEGAITEFKAAVLANPYEPLLYNQLALTYQKQGEQAMAHRILEQCLKTCPRSRATKRNMDRLAHGLDISVEHIQPRINMRFER